MHRYPTRYQAKMTEESRPSKKPRLNAVYPIEYSPEVQESRRVISQMLAEIQAHRDESRYTETLRKATDLFLYIEMHPSIVEQMPRFAEAINMKILELKEHGKGNHDKKSWDNFMLVCSRVLIMVTQIIASR